MKQITIPIPTMQHWRTTLFGVATAGAAAAVQYVQTGGLSWKECAAAAAWAGLCYLVPDAKGATPTKAQLAGLVESAVVAKLAEIGAPSTTEAPADAGK